MVQEPMHLGICIVDIEGFGRHPRNPTLVQMREVLYQTFHEGLCQASISEPERVLKDLGDGILALFAPQVPKPRLINPLVFRLVAALDAYNATAGPGMRMRLRVVVHAGEIVRHSDEHVGVDLTHAFRLLGSTTAHQRLAETEASLVLIVSQFFYEKVVAHGYPGIDPAAFEPVRVTMKETKRARAWIWTPSRDDDVDPPSFAA
jgi:class 3 adenylate cyclase